MTPATRALMEFLRDDGRGGDIPTEEYPRDEIEDPEQIKSWVMNVKKKRQQQLLKQMMRDAGYEDSVAMSGLKQEKIDYSNEEY